MNDIRIEDTKSNAELEYAIKTVYSEKGFDFTKDEWSFIKNAGYDKLDVAKLCCENAVMSEVECYERYVIVAWDNGPREEVVQKTLDERYEQWIDVEKYPEVDTFCCEEWMIDGLTGLVDFQFFVLYGEYDG